MRRESAARAGGAGTALRVGVLAGGPSSERQVSLRSGRAIFEALKTEGYEVKFLDVRGDACDTIKRSGIDIAFLALHGRYGEDGTVQAMLEKHGLPYTGSGVRASRLALDKVASKRVFRRNGIPVPRSMVFRKAARGLSRASRLGWPLVVKPQLEGSSIGLSVVQGPGGLGSAARKAFRYGDTIIIEEYIDGREVTVGILGDEALPVVEIVAAENVYDTHAKYTDTRTRYLVPAPLPERICAKARRLGLLAHRALGCRDLSRVDMRIDRRGRIFVLEVNSIPGMTARSLLPKAAEANGISFGELCVRLLDLARKKAARTRCSK